MEESRQDDMESPTTAVSGANATKDDDDFDGYVSLDISKEDSDQDKRRRNSFLYKTTEQLGATYTAMGKSEMVKTLSELRIPPPISRSEVRDMEQALGGDYQLHNHHDDHDDNDQRRNKNTNNVRRSIILLPNAKDVKQRLDDKQVVNNLTVDSATRRYRFLVAFLLKAEISPGLAFAEALLTWILLLSVISILFHGVSFVAITMGGLSLFATLTVTQFWYGVCRYPSVWNKYVRRGLRGIELDENFSEIRDICTRYCNGASENNAHPQQMTAFLTTLPFTIIYHVTAILFTVIYYVFGGIRSDKRSGKSIIPTPVTVSIFASNVLILFLWAFGGTFGVIFAALAVHFNQVFYNALLFRLDVRDFVLSIFLGGLLIVQDTTQDPIPFSIEDGVVQSDRALVDAEEGTRQATGEKDCSSHLKTVAKAKRIMRASTVDKNQNHVAATESSDNSILVQNSSISQRAVSISNQPYTSTTALHRPSDEFRTNEESDQSFGSSKLSPSDSVSRHQLKFMATVLKSDSTNHDSTSAQQVARAVPSIEPKKSVANAHFYHKDDATEMSSEFLNPSDIHLDLENHPGTITWRNIISESIQRFPVKTYTFRKHNWVMKRLHGRNFYIKENGQRRRQLGRSEVKKSCKDHHKKQMEVRLQIAGILGDLKDLKKVHESKSSSGHSRKSNSNKQALMVPSKDASLDAVEVAQYTMNAPGRKSFAENASAAKDAKTVESSKESTVSTLTCSQVHQPPTAEARSTPWIEGKSEIVARDPDTTPPINNSAHLRNAIYGILDYTNWLENLNKLSGDSPWNSEHKRSPDEEKRDVYKSDSIVGDTKECSTKPVGTEADIKSGGGIELVREESKKKNRQKMNTFDDDLPKSIHWDKQSREFVNTSDVRSRQRSRLFRGFWRCGLHQNKHKKLHTTYREEEQTKPKETKKGISFWRRKNKDLSVTILQNDKIRSSWGNPIEPVRSKELATVRAEARQDEPNTPIPNSRPEDFHRNPPPPPPLPPPSKRKRRSRVPPKDPLEISPYEAILSVMDEEYLRTWEGGDSSLDTRTKTIYTTESSSGDDTKKVLQEKNTKTTSHAFCGPPQECDALDGFTNACALQTTSHDCLSQPDVVIDVDDVDEDDIVALQPEVKAQETPFVASE